MTDLEKLEKTLTEIGVSYTTKTAKEEFHGEEIHTLKYIGETTFNKVLVMDEGVGYGGFKCDFYFLNGKFVNHGCWE